MAVKFSVFSAFKGIDGVSGPTKRMKKNVLGFSRATQKSLKNTQKSYLSLASVMKTALPFIGISAAIFAIGRQMTSVIKIGAEFEKTMIKAAVKFPEKLDKGSKAFEKLGEEVRRLAERTEFTARETAEGLEFLATAGFKATTAMKLLPQITDLATAASIELNEAASVSADLLGAFGLRSGSAAKQAKGLSRIMDVLAKTSTTSNVVVADLFETFKLAGAVGTEFGQSMETMAALTGNLANSALKGSITGTSLRRVFLQLNKTTGPGAELLKQMGIRVADSSGNMRDLFDILGDLEKKMKGMGTAQKGAALDIIFGARAVTGASILLRIGSKKLKEYRKELELARGASKKMADEIRKSVEVRMKLFNSAIESLKLNIFLSIAPIVSKITESMTKAALAASQWAKNNKVLIRDTLQKIINVLIGIGKVIGFVADQFIFINKTTGGFLVILAKLLIALKALNIILAINPVVLTVTAIIGAVAVLTALIRDFEGTIEKFKNIFQKVKGFVGGFFGKKQNIAVIGGEETPMSPNTNIIKSQQTIENRSVVDVNFNNVPKDTSIKQSGLAPGLSLNLGRAF